MGLIRTGSGIVLALSLTLPAMAQAQECLGLRSFRETPANISVDLRWQQDSRGPEGRLLFGKPRIFGGVNAGMLAIGQTNRVFSAGAHVGSSIDVGKFLKVCPIAGIARQPESPEDRRYPALTEVMFGGSAGGVIGLTPRLNLLPYAGASFLRSSFSSKYNDAFEPGEELVQSGPEVFGGLGLQINQQFIVRGGGRYRDGYGRRSRMVVFGVTMAPSRK